MMSKGMLLVAMAALFVLIASPATAWAAPPQSVEPSQTTSASTPPTGGIVTHLRKRCPPDDPDCFSVPTNRAPIISWTQVPTSGQYLLPTASIPISASASDPDGSVNYVEFVLDGSHYLSDTSSPYATQLSGLAAGSHSIQAIASDNLGRTTSTDTVTFTIRHSVVKGYIDSVSSSGLIKGWACSTYLPQSIRVDVYVGGTAGGSGTFIGRYLADQASGSAIDSACDVSGGSYRYLIQLSTAKRQAYAGQTIYIYGLSPVGTGNNALTHSGSFTVPAIPPQVATSTSIEYDALGRVLAVYDSAGHVKAKYVYDANNNVIQVTDALNHVTKMTYDALGRVSTTTDAADHTTTYHYDAGGRVDKVTDPRGNATTYTYDGFGQLWERKSPDTGITTYGYGAGGLLTGMTRNGGVFITYTYDALDRPISVNTGTQTRHMAYDNCTNGIGRVCSVSDATGTTTYTYDPQGDITQRQFTVDTTTYALDYAYDTLGRLAALTYPDGNQAVYQYQNGMASGITATVNGVSKSVVSTISYRPGDRLLTSWTAGNGLTTTYSYDADARLIGIHVPGVQSLDFTYDAADRITRIANGDALLTQDFTYDAMSRLAGVTTSSGNVTYSYDANGNRTAKTNNGVATDSPIEATSNQLVSVGGQAIGYDANGNTISVDGVVKYHYDSFNRLDSAGGMTYYINPEGQRLRKSGTLGTTYFAPDRSGALLAEHPDSGWVDYVWLGGRLVGRLAGGQVQAMHTDQVGRPEAVTNASKAIIWQAHNWPFVRTVTTANITLNIGFPGQYYDAETGLWHNGYRDYVPTSGRYIESDPIGLGGGLNTYAYVGNNPISNVDSLGLLCFDFNQFANDIEKDRFDLNAVLGTLLTDLGVGTMPKTPKELRGFGVPKEKLNPYTNQLSRWSRRLGTRKLRKIGRTVGGKLVGRLATGAVLVEGGYDLFVEIRAAVKATKSGDCGCNKDK